MRTGSFSDRRTQRVLNTQFVNTFVNTTGDPTSGSSINHRPKDPSGLCVRGNGKQNVQTLFLTPNGEVFHVATGFLSAKDLADEAVFASELFSEIKGIDDATEPVVVTHRQRLLDTGFDQSLIDNNSPVARMQMMATEFGQLAKQVGANGGSSNRNLSRANPFQAFSRNQFLEDNLFSIRNPLIDYVDLERDPTKLVGNGKSFFASSSSSN